MYTVYLITNRVNGKKYVGITKRNYLERYKEHLNLAISGSKLHLYCAMRKYGVDNFTVEIVEENIPQELIDAREQYYISQFCTFYRYGKGYNMTSGGGGVRNYSHSADTRKRISDKLTGHKFSERRNLKIKEAMMGREYKQEWKDALSKARLGRFKQEENPFFGKQHTPATKAIVSRKNTKYNVAQLDPDTLEEIQIFQNAMAAGRWVVNQNLSSAKPSTCEGRISEVCRNKNLKSTAYTYKWKFKEKSID